MGFRCKATAQHGVVIAVKDIRQHLQDGTEVATTGTKPHIIKPRPVEEMECEDYDDFYDGVDDTECDYDGDKEQYGATEDWMEITEKLTNLLDPINEKHDTKLIVAELPGTMERGKVRFNSVIVRPFHTAVSTDAWGSDNCTHQFTAWPFPIEMTSNELAAMKEFLLLLGLPADEYKPMLVTELYAG